MVKLLGKVLTMLAVVAIAFASIDCRKTTKETEVKDKFFGGTEVKEKTVTEDGNRATVTEEKTEYNEEGEKIKTEKKTTGD